MKLPDGTVIGGFAPENGLSAFITVDMAFSKEIGQSRRTFDGTTETIATSLLSTVQISCYGNNAYAMAVKLRTVLQSSRMIESVKAMNAGIVSFSDVRNLTATVGADYEERGLFDVVISHCHLVQTPLEAIEQVDVSQTIQSQIRPHP